MLAVVLVERIGVGLEACRFWFSLFQLNVFNYSDGNLFSPKAEMAVVCLVDVFVTNFFT